MTVLKENIPLLELVNINTWNKNGYNGSVHVVIFDKKGSPLKSIENAYAPFCPIFIHSHATNVCSVIRNFSEARITMLYNNDECRRWFEEHADEVDIVNISMSAFKNLSEHSWGFLEKYDLPVFCSSGNDGDDELNYPSAFPWTLSIGATSKLKVVDYSNWSDSNSNDDQLDCVGITNVYVENSDRDIFKFSGTSCSSPQVASTVAHYAHFIKENYNRKLGRQETFDFIHANCIDIKDTERDGYGLFVLPNIPIIEKPIIPEPEIIIIDPLSPLITTNIFYRVVTGSFEIRDNINKRINALKAKGFDSFTLIAEVNGKAMFRCITGSFNERSNCEKRIEDLKAKGFDSFIAIYKK